MPAVILMAVDQYDGLGSMEINGVHVMPIVLVEAQWQMKSNVCLRKQFPLMLAFAITAYRSKTTTDRA